MALRHATLLPMTIVAGCGAATAQTARQVDIAFALSPDPARADTTPVQHAPSYRYAIVATAPVPSDAGLRALPISLQRRTTRFGTVPVAPLAARPATDRPTMRRDDLRPRSRVSTLRIEERLPLGGQVTATLGWHGMKVSNRNANATIGGGDDRLSAHDWFLPRVALAYRPAADLTVSLGYRQSLRAYDGAGESGAMGLSRPAFDALRDRLQPERTRHWHVEGQWVHDMLRLTLGGYRGTLGNALSFQDYAPLNVGSANLVGMSAALAGQVTPRLRWSASYRRASGRTATGSTLGEQEIGIGGSWATGPWRGSLSANHANGGALPGLLDDRRAPMRVEAAVEYSANRPAGRPLLLSMRLTDPSRLASARFSDDDGSGGGGLRATDRARAVMFEATTSW